MDFLKANLVAYVRDIDPCKWAPSSLPLSLSVYGDASHGMVAVHPSREGLLAVVGLWEKTLREVRETKSQREIQLALIDVDHMFAGGCAELLDPTRFLLPFEFHTVTTLGQGSDTAVDHEGPVRRRPHPHSHVSPLSRCPDHSPANESGILPFVVNP